MPISLFRDLPFRQRITLKQARLALGVTTENLHTTHDPYAQMSDEELAAELSRLGIEPTEPTLQ